MFEQLVNVAREMRSGMRLVSNSNAVEWQGRLRDISQSEQLAPGNLMPSLGLNICWIGLNPKRATIRGLSIKERVKGFNEAPPLKRLVYHTKTFILSYEKLSCIDSKSQRPMCQQRKKDKNCGTCDTCVIRTHAPEGTALAGQRVNHSAKVPRYCQCCKR